MIKVKIRNILDANDALTRLSQNTLPIKTSYDIAKVLNRVREEVRIYDTERIKMLEKHGTLNEEKTEYVFETPEKMQAFQKEHNELMDVDVEIDVKPIVLKSTDNIRITAQEIINLGAFVEVVDCD